LAIQITNSKSQIPNKFKAPIFNDETGFVEKLGFGSLAIICDLVLGIWCLFRIWKSTANNYFTEKRDNL
jgi:hypothetical protein